MPTATLQPHLRRQVTGILAVECHHGGSWRRIIFLAEPLEDAAPSTAAASATAVNPPTAAKRYRCKTLPDVESVGACWVSAQQVPQIPLRCESEPLTWIPHVAGGGAVAPLDPKLPELLRVFPDYPLL